MEKDQIQAIQAKKNEFAAVQNPPIDPCANASCGFTGCTCGKKCGCGLPAMIASGELESCDPCMEFKKSKVKS